MKKLFTYIVKQEKFALLLTLMVLALGLGAGIQIKKDMFPNIEFGVVLIETNYQNASPSDVESQITNKIEDAIKGINGIKRFRSESREGFSRINVILDIDTKNKEEVKSNIRDAITKINDFPENLEKKPSITVKNSDSYPLLEIFINGDMDYKKIRNHAKEIEKQIKEIPGISNIGKIGFYEKETLVKLDLDKLKKYKITIPTVISKIKDKNQRQSNGLIESYNDEKQIISHFEFKSTKDIENIIIQSNYEGTAIYVKDIAKVTEGYEKAKIIAKLNGKRGIGLNVYRSGSSDIVTVAKKVKEQLSNYQKLHDEIDIAYAKDYSYYVENRFSIVKNNGIIGLLLVLLLLTIFLGFRIAFWVALGIPVSILGTIFYMYMTGKPLDILSMAGFIIVIGIIVDDSIVVAESITQEREKGKNAIQASIDGISNVFQPVLTTILTTGVAFVPLLIMPGLVGKFIVAIPLVITISLFISLLECGIALPGHLVKGLNKIKPQKESENIKKFEKIKLTYKKTLIKLINHRYIVILVFIGLFIGSIYLAINKIDFILFPNESAEQIDINYELEVGTSLEKTAEKTKELEKIIHQLNTKERKAYFSKIGMSWDAENEVISRSHNNGVISLYLTKWDSKRRTAKEIQYELEPKLKAIKDIKKMNITTESGGPPVGAPISIEIISNDDRKRNDITKKIQTILENNPLIKNIERNDTLQKKEKRLNVNNEKLSRLKIRLKDILYTIQGVYKGVTIAEITQNNETTKYKVIAEERFRKNTESLDKLYINNSQNKKVPLKNLISFQDGEGTSNYYHYKGIRSITIKAAINDKKTTVKRITKELEKEIDKLNKENVEIKFGGEAEEINKSFDSLKISFILALLGIYLILVVLFNSYWQPFIVLTAIPFAITGVILAFYTHQQPFTFLALLGTVGLTGVVVNDSLILVYQINRLRRENPDKSLIENISTACMHRIRPILLTTLTSSLGMLPLSYGIGGYDPFVAPMGLALGFGLFFSTPLILTLLPCIYHIIQDCKKEILRNKKKNAL
ncbi:MAG: efflux RND transporter permease subunit [bacterium]